MIYPTVVIKKKVHAVCDETTCLCGAIYNKEFLEKRKDLLKRIQFKKISSINCRKCKSLLLKLVK